MTVSFRSIFAATVLAGTALTAAPAMAQDESDLSVSANVALVSDYRFRGVSLSGGDFAIQGGVDVAHSSGFYVGTWASSLDETGSVYGSTELDIYGGWSGALNESLSVDVGMLVYLYPDADGDFGCNCDYWEPYASVTGAVGPAEVTVGVAYAWEQSSLGDEDNLYLYGDVGFGIPETPVSFVAHLGYTDGILATQGDGTSFDWSLGASVGVMGVDLGLSYVDTQGPSIKHLTDDAIVASLSASF
ncbi:TorF family putative porin [Croceicoccus sediminis]|uniref:TorF family putative porin n=1 Tax=Croceicoccus sediminis TaxID=2571150 RepID=UPI0011832304|nr:TorF family putative porin [Croceicoccus sediminis]